MAAPGFGVPFTDVALSAATAKTVAYVIADRETTIKAVDLTFDGVSASAVPVLIELCIGTAATNSTPGTGSTTVQPLPLRGRPTGASLTSSGARTTAARACTSEPTVLTPIKVWRISPTSGILYQFPLGGEIEVDAGGMGATVVNKMFALRCTAAATVNVTGNIEFEE